MAFRRYPLVSLISIPTVSLEFLQALIISVCLDYFPGWLCCYSFFNLNYNPLFTPLSNSKNIEKIDSKNGNCTNYKKKYSNLYAEKQTR